MTIRIKPHGRPFSVEELREYVEPDGYLTTILGITLSKLVAQDNPQLRTWVSEAVTGHVRGLSDLGLQILTGTPEGLDPTGNPEVEAGEIRGHVSLLVHGRVEFEELEEEQEEPPAPKLVFQHGTIHGVRFWPMPQHKDERGWLTELFRRDEPAAVPMPAMGYVSQTLPGQVRGPHEHRRQTDYFMFVGPGTFGVYLWDARPTSVTRGRVHTLVVGADCPMTVIVPPGVIHAYKNIGSVPGLVMNFPDQLYKGEGRQQEVDEIRHEGDPNSPYQLI